MQIIILEPEYRNQFVVALDAATTGTAPEWVQSHDDTEIIGTAVLFRDQAVQVIREALEASQEAFPADAKVEIGPDEVAMVAILLALQEMEGWGNWHVEDYLDSLVLRKKCLAWIEQKRNQILFS